MSEDQLLNRTKASRLTDMLEGFELASDKSKEKENEEEIVKDRLFWGF
jgi:hypothetical protein